MIRCSRSKTLISKIALAETKNIQPPKRGMDALNRFAQPSKLLPREKATAPKRMGAVRLSLGRGFSSRQSKIPEKRRFTNGARFKVHRFKSLPFGTAPAARSRLVHYPVHCAGIRRLCARNAEALTRDASADVMSSESASHCVNS